MSDGVTFTLEGADELLAVLKALGPAMDHRCRAVAKDTAERIAAEARSRLARQLGPTATGQTVASIVVEEDAAGTGYLVLTDRDPFPMLPRWLEWGTTHMSQRSFFYSAARLEEGGHRRRIEDAVQETITGLGE